MVVNASGRIVNFTNNNLLVCWRNKEAVLILFRHCSNDFSSYISS